MSRTIDLEEIRRRAQARLDWDGGCALPETVAPEDILWLVNRVRALATLVPFADHRPGCSMTGTECSCGYSRAERYARV